MTGQLTCAGEYGCHGDRSAGNSELDSLRPGSHHVADDPTLGDSIPNSYRFLDSIKGIEDASWEINASSTDHNQYLGATTGVGSGDTISDFCAECHGDFHNADNASPFLRHPTDVSLPLDANSEHSAYVNYKPETPVASSDLSWGVLDVVNTNGERRIVTCISCHRAHGTPWDSILRWDYKSWPGGGYNGCADCHSYKN